MHVITGEIRKEPYTKEYQSQNGAGKMYVIELSERMKIRNRETGSDDTVYTNYKATFFATQAQIPWYNEAFKGGKVVSICCDSLNIISREYNGKVYVHNEMIRPQLKFSQREDNGEKGNQGTGGNQGKTAGWGEPVQPKSSSGSQQQSSSQPPMDFDDDIPF